MSELLKLYPGWKEAANHIVKRVEAEGYGVTFTFAELFKLMDYVKPEFASWEEWEKASFDRLQNIENLKETLLKDHNLCLNNVRGQGYQVLHPDDQVTVATEKRFKNARAQVQKAIELLINVNQADLSFDGQQHQMRQMERGAFLKGVMSKGKKVANGGIVAPKELPEKV